MFRPSFESRALRPRPILLATAIGTLALFPIMVARHLPLVDAPGHEAELAVLHDLLFTNGGSAFYDRGTLLLPDLGFDALGTALIIFFVPETTGRIFLALTMVVTLCGLLALNRTVTRRWSIFPLAAVLLLYNLVVTLGFFSYLLGLALVPWALAARLRLPPNRPSESFALGSALGIVLVFCHALAFGSYATFWIGTTIGARVSARIDRRTAVLRGLELAAPIGCFLVTMRSGPSPALYDGHLLEDKLVDILKTP